MHTAPHIRWSTVLMAVLLLMGTAAPMLTRMTCVVSGRVQMQVGQAKDCCPEREKGHGAHLEAVCCVFEQAAPKHEVFTPPVFGGPLAQEYVALQPEAIIRIPAAPEVFRPAIGTRPPPLLPGERLSLHGTFRI
jgi:hypothetical protein